MVRKIFNDGNFDKKIFFENNKIIKKQKPDSADIKKALDELKNNKDNKIPGVEIEYPEETFINFDEETPKNYTTHAVEEEGGKNIMDDLRKNGGTKYTTMAVGEEGGENITSSALDEEGGNNIMDDLRKNGGTKYTTMALGEEGGQ